jgi:hypothetical protein
MTLDVQIGDRVLLPDLTAGTVEELDLDGYCGVRCDSWEGLGVPSCVTSWCDRAMLVPLPAGYVPQFHSAEERVEAARFTARVLEALEELPDRDPVPQVAS